jgi:hypothetical protein
MPGVDELRRQRDLVAQHLSWLDAQIAKQSPTAADPAPKAASLPIASFTSGSTPPIPERFLAESANAPVQARRGCFLLFAVGCAITLLAATLIWWFGYRN